MRASIMFDSGVGLHPLLALDDDTTLMQLALSRWLPGMSWIQNISRRLLPQCAFLQAV